MSKNNNGCAAIQFCDVLLKPSELIGSKIAESARLEVHHVHKTDEMRAAGIEAVPAIANAITPETLAIHFAAVV